MLSHDAVKLMKTQDSGYLRTMIQKTRRALGKLEQEILIGKDDQGSVEVRALKSEMGPSGKHVFLVDDQEAQSRHALLTGLSSTTGKMGEGAGNDTSERDLGDQGHQKSRRIIEKEEQAAKAERLRQKQHRNEQKSRRSKLAALKTREKDLVDAENELELQRAKMSNNFGGVNKNGVKWKVRERKK